MRLDSNRSDPDAAEMTVSCHRCNALHRPESYLSLHPVCDECRHAAPAEPADPRGFHALSERAITGAVGETSPGNYALGYREGSTFTVFYVGRSDSDVNATLQSWVDAPSHPPRRQRPSPHASWRAPVGPATGRGPRVLAGTSIGIDTAYTHFAFCYAPSPFAAFEQECRDYHALGGSDGLDNPRHPEPPDGSPWACPMHG